MSKKVLLFANLGSPDSTQVKDVRRYLSQFLMDPRVIDIPYLLRLLLVRGIISPLRAFSSAQKYKTIWTEEGSPLIIYTKALAALVEQEANMPCYVCMRYGNPSAADTMELIEKEHPDLEEMILIPLYPHYAMSSFETAVEHVRDIYKQKDRKFSLQVVPPFFKNEEYIDVLTESIRPYVQDPFDLLIFSYHGIPERHVRKTDMTGKHCLKCDNCCEVESQAHTTCYRHQVKTTTELVRDKLGVPAEKVMFSFQSRLGKDEWLKPYTAKTLEELPKQGIKRLVICSPAFVSDCLETLEEIHEEGMEIFMENGGESFVAIPCLNTRPDWVSSMVKITQTAK